MKILSKALRPSVRGLAAVSLLATTLAAVAATSTQAAQVVVHPQFCSVGQRSFNDLDALVQAVRAAGAPSVAVTACGSVAIPSWLATVQRLSDAHLEIDVLDGSARACAAPAGPMRVSQSAHDSLSGIDAVAVEHYWRQVQP